MTRLPERTAALAAAFSAVAFVMDLLLARRTHLLACSALLPFLFLCAAISLLVFVRLRLRRLAAEEARDEALARSEAASSAMFASEGGSEAFTVARSRDQFEKYFVSAVAPLLAVGLALWTFRLWRGLPWGLTQPADPLLACAFLAGQAFFFFLLCRYDVGLSRSVDWRILRGPAMAAGLASLGSMAAAASAAAAASTVSAADPLMARALILVTGALAVECLLSFIVALYSPRRGAALAVAYESRLATWFADPAGWARNMAQALDYQFGFQVTETGFFRLIRRALAPLLAAQIALLYLMSSLVFIGPDEEAVLEHFGKPPSDGAGLSSGFHLKWPWPFETLRRFPARRMLTTHVGYQSEPGDAKPPVLLWTIPHYRTEDSFLVPSAGAGAGDSGAVPVNLVSVNMPVEYRITNIHHFAYNVSDPEAALRHVAYRALTREVGALDLFALLGEQRPAVGDRLRDRIQRDAEALGLGVRIEFVGLQGVHPPVGVAPGFV
jgi:regulator of protease activity HflC (stomatin/prohibitin superfamily)